MPGFVFNLVSNDTLHLEMHALQERYLVLQYTQASMPTAYC